MKSRRLISMLLPLIPGVFGAMLLEVAVRRGWLPAFLVPSPSGVWQSLTDNFDELRDATLRTLASAITGFVLSGLLGVTVAILLSSARWIERMFYPYAVMLQTVPIIAIAPLLVIWIGFDWRSVVVCVVIVAIFPIIANTLAGLRSTDPALRDLFQLYRASRFPTLFKLRLPFALPNIFVGLRIAAGLSVIGAIIGEFITGGGIGGTIDIAKTQQDVNKIFAVLLIGSLLGICLFGLINLASWLTLRRWHASEGDR